MAGIKSNVNVVIKDTGLDEIFKPRLQREQIDLETIRLAREATEGGGNRMGQKKPGYADEHRQMKVVARLPEDLIIRLLATDPDFLRDKKNIYRVLNRYKGWYDAYDRQGIK